MKIAVFVLVFAAVFLVSEGFPTPNPPAGNAGGEDAPAESSGTLSRWWNKLKQATKATVDFANDNIVVGAVKDLGSAAHKLAKTGVAKLNRYLNGEPDASPK